MDNNQMRVDIERIFECRADKVWNMWTNAEDFKTWYGPNGFTIEVMKMDAVVDGEQFVCMIMPGGENKMFTRGNYKEVIVNKKLVYTDSPCDENGKLLEPEAMGMPEGMHMTTEVVIELSEADGKTKMMMSHIGVPEGAKGA